MKRVLVQRLDRLTLAGIAVGTALMLQPWWSGGFEAGFFVTAVFVAAQIVAAHLPNGESA